MIRLLLVDDHAVVRAGLRLLLETQPDFTVVGEAATGEIGLLLASTTESDVVLLDLDLGDGLGGIDVARQLCQRPDGPAVLILTTYDTDADIVRAVDAGAIGYLLKSATPEDIGHAIRDAAQGRNVMSAPVASRMMHHLQRASDALTAREAEVLELLATGMTNRQLGERLFISETTVKTHLAHVYGKLNVETRGAAIAVALQRGLVRRVRG